jgi:sugar/nucleoside kinase (ribokinase family)
MQPAQSTVLDAARRANDFGVKVSVDLNYAPSVWPDRENVWKVISEYCSYNALIKISEDDAERLYDRNDLDYDEVIQDFHQKGAELVCFTLGAKGSIISGKWGKEKFFLEGRKIEVIDATGAGDAFWSGFLTAMLDGKDLQTCANAGANVAEMKLTTKGPLPMGLGKEILYK